MKYLFHIAAFNERWDTIAYKYYGNCYKIAPIIMANPHVPISPVIPEGINIAVPIDEESGSEELLSKLPIWKRG